MPIQTEVGENTNISLIIENAINQYTSYTNELQIRSEHFLKIILNEKERIDTVQGSLSHFISALSQFEKSADVSEHIAIIVVKNLKDSFGRICAWFKSTSKPITPSCVIDLDVNHTNIYMHILSELQKADISKIIIRNYFEKHNFS